MDQTNQLVQPATTADRPANRVASAANSTPQTTTKKSHRAWLWLVAIVLIGGIAASIIYFYSGRAAGDAGANGSGAGGGHGHGGNQATPVTVATARKGNMDRLLVGLGSVTPFNTATIRSRVDGQIMKVNFVEGQLIKEGDPLFEIDPRPYQVQLDQAQGQMLKDQAVLQNAKLNVKRDTEAKEAIAAQQLDTDTAAQSQAEGAVKIDQAQIDSAKLEITYSHITAPIAGRIGLRLVDEGNLVHATDATGLAVITQLQPIAIIFSLPEDDIPRVVLSMKSNASLPVDAYARDLRTKLATGKLLTIDNQVDPTAGTFRLKAEFANEDSSLFPSQFVSARLLAETLHDTTIIPSAAVQQGPDFSYVYVVKSDKTVELRKVKVTTAAGNEILLANPRPQGAGDEASIESGIEPGETVVIDGIDKLRDGAAVSFGEGHGGGGGAPGGESRRGGGGGHRPASSQTS